jgi:hypothetical protein
MSAEASLPVIGWKEHLDFPEWSVRRVRVKIDTGARTSAIDTLRYDLQETADGTWVEAEFALRRKRPPLRLRLPVVRLTTVRSTSGVAERRPVIEALVQLGPVSWRMQLTLARRSGLRFRVILGRRALAGLFLIDPGQTYRQRHA